MDGRSIHHPPCFFGYHLGIVLGCGAQEIQLSLVKCQQNLISAGLYMVHLGSNVGSRHDFLYPPIHLCIPFLSPIGYRTYRSHPRTPASLSQLFCAPSIRNFTITVGSTIGLEDLERLGDDESFGLCALKYVIRVCFILIVVVQPMSSPPLSSSLCTSSIYLLFILTLPFTLLSSPSNPIISTYV